MGGDTGGDGRVGGVDGERVGSPVGIGVFEHHLWQSEGAGQGVGDRSAYQTTRLRQEIRRGSGDGGCAELP